MFKGTKGTSDVQIFINNVRIKTADVRKGEAEGGVTTPFTYKNLSESLWGI